ncbi:protein draper-like [Pomacea canaliculata]|uniref:protein draper-like n=1 Tax=Pomacea canaliculata TaxID=400727 RepID=UPI000D740022|nr:protein draper-like [Pomacea canaliculata]
MGLLLLSTTFLYLLVIDATFAAKVPAGSECPESSSGNTCDDDTVCDKVHGKCLLKVGKACTGTNQHNCVFGASCGATNCECGAGYTEKSEICAPQHSGTVGFDCSTNAALCTTPNSECSDQGACKCKTGFVINIADGQCDHDVGTPCTTGDTCVAASVCDNVAEKCLLKADQSCTAENEKNCVSGASCQANGCTCGAGYTTHTDKTCTPKTPGTVGFDCTSNDDLCTTANSECSSLKACKCKDGFLLNIANGQCDGNVGTPCTTGDTCVASSVCDNVAEKCLLKADQSCTAENEKNCVSGASCQANGCTCGAGYTTHTDKTCTPKTPGTVGFDCTSGVSVCTTANSECSSLKACKCQNGFLLNITNGQCDHDVGTPCTPGDTCVASSVCDNVAGKCSIIHGESCPTGSDKCVSNAACVDNVCKCDATKAISSTAGLCLLKTGQACTVKSYCVVGATCKSTCQCSNDFAENAATKLCEAKAGTACSSDVPCVGSTVCESGKCLIKHGSSCADNLNNCVPHAACVSDVCQCDVSTTVAAPSGLCTLKNEGSNSAKISFWLLIAALVSLSLADYLM